MPRTRIKTYLYLARRDKKAVRLLAVFKTGKLGFLSRVNDVAKLNMPETMTKQIQKIVHEERMYWEPFLETAESYSKFIQSLKKQGYITLPPLESPEITAMDSPVASTPNQKPSGMLRKQN